MKNAWNFNLWIRWMQIRVSMEVGNWYLRDLQPTFMRVIIQLLSTMDIQASLFFCGVAGFFGSFLLGNF